MFNRIRIFLGTRVPLFFGIAYFLLIPFFALIYFCQPLNAFNTKLDMHNFVTCLYFSTVTITTLGFGDVSPVTIGAQVAVIIESILGLFNIGLFLNALAQAQSTRITNTERAANARLLRSQQVARLLRFDKLIQLAIYDYQIYTWAMTTPALKRNDSEVKVNADFVFGDMVDIFGPSFIGADMFEPVLSIYLRKQAQLVSDVKNLLLNVDLEPWPRLEQACQRFLENCNATGIAEGLVEQGKNEKLKNEIQKYIREEKDDPDYYNYGHIVNPVIVFYKSIKENLIFLEEYQQFIERVKSE